MAYDVATLTASVQTRAKDPSFSATTILTFFQAIQDEILGKHMLSVAETSDSSTISEDDTESPQPTGCQLILELSLVPSSNSNLVYQPRYIKYREFLAKHPQRLVTGAVTPWCYTIFGSEILWPAPLNEDYTMKTRFIQRSPTITTTFTLPQEYKEIYELAGLAGIEEFRRNFDLAAIYRRRIEDLKEDLVRRYSMRNLNALPKASSARFIRGRGEGAFD